MARAALLRAAEALADAQAARMIARIWKGWARRDDAARYEALFRDTVLPHVTAGVAGYRGVQLLQRDLGTEVEFTTMFWFDSMDAVRAFAGDEPERAVVPAPVRQLLSRFQDTVEHHQMVLTRPEAADR